MLIGGLGATELLLIVVVILLLFGGRKIPELMRSLGEGIREFKKATRETEKELDAPEASKKQEPGHTA